MRERKPLLMLGAGDMAATYLEEFRNDATYEVVGLVQDADPTLVGQARHGRPILSVEEALKLSRTHAVIGAIGSPDRQALIERFERAGFEFATLISPTAVVHGREGIEPGCIVCDLANIDPHIRIGRHTIVTSGVTVAHHCTIGAYSFISSGVQFGGNCRVGQRCFIGTGAIIRDHITIGDGATVGAGAVVVKDVARGTTVTGVPARPLVRRGAVGAHHPSTRRPLLILGAGLQAATYLEHFRDDPQFEIVGFVQDADPTRIGQTLEGLPIHDPEQALKLAATHSVICAIGSPERRRLIERFEDAGFDFARLISPRAVVTRSASIGPGCIVTDFATVETGCEIGPHTLVMRGCLVAHHTRVGAFSNISPSANVGGACRIGEQCIIGMGATIRDHVTIGDRATVGAGAVVVKDVAPGATVAGNPARSLGTTAGGEVASPRRRQPVLLLGAGEQAASYAENVADHPDYEVVGFVQDVDPERRVRELEGRPVYYIEDVKDWHATHRVVCCIGSMQKREIIGRFETMGFGFATLVATTALISPKAELGPGCFVSHTGQVASFAKVGAHTMIGRQTMVGHHSTVGAYSLIAGNSVIGGGAKIGEGCFIGMGSLIRDHVTLGDNVTVGVGAVVVKDVPSGVTVVGNPARILEPKGQGPTSEGKPRRPVLFLGAGSMAENYAQIFRDDEEYEVAGFVQDSDPGQNDKTLSGRPVYWIGDALKLAPTHAVISCVGSAKKKAMIERFEAAGFRFATMIAPSARVDPLAEVGPGCFINHDTSIAPYTKVGAHTMIMRRVVFGHHSEIGPYGTIGPGALIAGTVRIGASCFVGIGSIISDHLTLGDGVTVGAGAVVVRDVPEGTTVVGNPARPLPPKEGGSPGRRPA